MTRLVRGLASARESARQGFLLALLQILETFREVLSLSACAAKITKGLNEKNAADKQEKKETQMGRMFALMALAKSGILARASASESHDVLPPLLEEPLQKAAKTKNPFQELCCETVTLLLETMKETQIKESVLPYLTPLLQVPPAAWSLPLLCLALRIEKAHPEFLSQIPSLKRGGSLLSGENLHQLLPLLKDAAGNERTENPVWELVLQLCFTKKSEEQFRMLSTLYKQLVLPQFQQQPQSKQQTEALRIGARLLRELVSHVRAKAPSAASAAELLSRLCGDLVPVVLPAVAARQTIKAQMALKELLTELSNLPGFAARFLDLTLESTLQPAGRSKKTVPSVSKLLHPLLATCGAEGDASTPVLYVKKLLEKFVALQTHPDAKPRLSLWLLDQVTVCMHFCTHAKRALPQAGGDVTAVVRLVLTFFFTHAYFAGAVNSVPSVAKLGAPWAFPAAGLGLSQKLRSECSLRLFNIMSHLHAVTVTLERKPATQNSDAEVSKEKKKEKEDTARGVGIHEWARELTIVMLELEGTEGVTANAALPEDAKTALRSAKDVTFDIVKQVAGSNPGAAFRLRAFMYLLHAVVLFSFASVGEAPQLLQDLAQCYRKLKANLVSGEPVPAKLNDDLAVLVDGLISTLAWPSRFIREVAVYTFGVLSPMYTLEALQLVTDAISSEEALEEGVKDEVEEEVEEEEVEKEEVGSTDEDEQEEDEDSEVAGEDEDKEGGEEEEETAKQPPVKRVKAGEEEKQEKKKQKEEEEEGDSDESEVWDMDADEEQLMAFDRKLAEMFRLRREDDIKKHKKVGQADPLRETAVTFRLHLTELLHAFARRHPSSPLILGMTRLLVDCVAAVLQKPDKQKKALAAHLQKFVMSLLDKEYPKLQASEAAAANAALIVVLAKLNNAKPLLSSMIAGVCCLHMKALLESEGDAKFGALDYATVAKALGDTFTGMLHGTRASHAIEMVLRRVPRVGWLVFSLLLQAVTSAKTPFLRKLCADLVTALLQERSDCFRDNVAAHLGEITDLVLRHLGEAKRADRALLIALVTAAFEAALAANGGDRAKAFDAVGGPRLEPALTPLLEENGVKQATARCLSLLTGREVTPAVVTALQRKEKRDQRRAKGGARYKPAAAAK
eukprot:TRINITY_DN1296_c3_g1_i2.p1 TRINITY_DN1296_c3_g1~~TRINITY_DN1296_c3_g1_i2.p1  ORF type:complete len:1222 (+),score=440.92 TRINITY_DN1296_c3_g1_i2:272-3667(+)